MSLLVPEAHDSAMSLIACFDGAGYGQLALAAGMTAVAAGGPTGHAVLPEPPWTIAKRAASRAAEANVSFTQITRPKSKSPTSRRMKIGKTRANSTIACPRG